MITMNVSQARQRFLEIINRVYAGEEFKFTKNKIPIAHLEPIRKEKIIKKKILPGATKLLSHLKGSTIEIADKLRRDALYGKYGSR